MAVGSVNSSIGESSFWKRTFVDTADPRTVEWFLMGSPIPLFAIIATYLLLVLKVGPAYMKNRRPYQLKSIMMVYNIVQVFANCYLFILAASAWKRYDWKCQPVDYSNSVTGLADAWACYLYFLNKVSDLLDTVFFTLRKKQNQVSFLHVFHHTIMPTVMWSIVRYVPGGHITFIGLLNTFVHIVLYGYYFLAALGPKIQKHLWWKKYITKLQLIQFCLAFLHSLQLLIFNCEYPRWTLMITLPNATFFYYLFSDFYKKSYVEPATSKKVKNGLKIK